MTIHWTAIARTLGGLLLFAGAALLAPAGVALGYGEAAWWSFGGTALGTLVTGSALWFGLGGVAPQDKDLGIREGFVIVALSWVVLSLVGALPFVISDVLPTYTDAFFETMSGFTTTGATIFGGGGNMNIEAMPRSFLFWRSLTHWIGGMGIILLTLAILPILGIGGFQLYRAEVPGPSADKLTPRVRETARRLWLVYVGITAVQVLFLLPAMSGFDAINHAFATMATGGFSTKNGSVSDFDSAYVDSVITLFMVLAGMNFALHYRMLRGKAITVWRDTELRVYLAIIAGATVLLIVSTWTASGAGLPVASEAQTSFAGYESLGEALRYGVFQAVAIITSTGFGTADYEMWPPLAVGVIFLLFFCGGMAGSTGGGVKVMRHVVLAKNALNEFKQLVHPRAVLRTHLNGQPIAPAVLRNVLLFVVLYVLLLFLGTLALAALGQDLWTAFGAALSCVGNIGPGWGTVGPTENYAHLPALSKWILSFLMMAGRLEIVTVLIVFTPAFWRR